MAAIYGEEWCVIDDCAKIFCIRISDDIDDPKWTLCLQVFFFIYSRFPVTVLTLYYWRQLYSFNYSCVTCSNLSFRCWLLLTIDDLNVCVVRSLSSNAFIDNIGLSCASYLSVLHLPLADSSFSSFHYLLHLIEEGINLGRWLAFSEKE